MDINDEEALKKENITIDNSTKEFEDKIKKLNNLENSIKHEMLEIDKAYEKVDKETTIAYQLKREKLNEEEENLKEKLKTEVTKIKEKLENYLSQTLSFSKTCERIIKGIKSLQNEKEKNMIKTLSYVSFISKNKKKMDLLTQELMKNLEITFIKEEGGIKYEEYYFNGFPVPKDIEFKEIESDKFKVFWKLDDINIINIDKNQIQYIFELKKENEEKFNKMYEGKFTNWSEIKKVKTSIISLILNRSEKGNEFLEKLREWTGYNKLELLYRGTRDGCESNIFHNKCDNQGPTICLCQNEKDNIFGGYASISWASNGGNKSANGSFLFSLTNIYKTDPIKFPNTRNYDLAVYHMPNFGPTFGGGHDIYVSNDYFNNTNSYCSLGYSYQDILGKGNSVFTGDIHTNKLKLKELEVFKLLN